MSEHNNLNRFLEAQAKQYEEALAQIESGAKTTHWCWFIFPQLLGLGQSETAKFYGIKGIEEAMAYAQHPVLYPRLIAAHEALVVSDKSVVEIMGELDAQKVQSSATLFSLLPGADLIFQMILAHFFQGRVCQATVKGLVT